MIKFTIFSFPRSGSTFLCSLLGSHPDILCHFEVFHRQAIGTVKDFNATAEEMRTFIPQSRDERPGDFLNTLFKYPMGRQAVGFKIFVGQSGAAHDIILKDREIKKILLKRDTIDAYVSRLIARETGAYTQKDMPPGMTAPKVSFDVREFLAVDREVGEYFSQLERDLRETGQDFLVIRYEDMASDQTVVDSIFSFLGIERGTAQLSAFTRKQNKSALQDKLDNLEEAFRDFTSLYLKLRKSNENTDALTSGLRSQLQEKEHLLQEMRDSTDAMIGGLRNQLQSKEHLLQEMRDSTDALIGGLRNQLQSKEHLLQEMHSSLSWKLTKPLRFIGGRFGVGK